MTPLTRHPLTARSVPPPHRRAGTRYRAGTPDGHSAALFARLVSAFVLACALWVAPAHAQETYTVRPGDTLYRIATTHDMSVDELRELNGLTSNTISVGQELIVSGDGEAAPDGALGGVPERVRDAVGLPDTAVVSDTTIAAGRVVVFPESYAGRVMAGGDPYDPSAFVASHPDLPMGTVVLLEHRDARRVALARIGDRGPASEDAVMEVSQAVADELGLDGDDASTVYVRPVE
ncbi:MAG: LysM peptidoglycan-binding domain-containing protein [Rhodothermales bacterium]